MEVDILLLFQLLLCKFTQSEVAFLPDTNIGGVMEWRYLSTSWQEMSCRVEICFKDEIAQSQNPSNLPLYWLRKRWNRNRVECTLPKKDVIILKNVKKPWHLNLKCCKLLVLSIPWSFAGFYWFWSGQGYYRPKKW